MAMGREIENATGNLEYGARVMSIRILNYWKMPLEQPRRKENSFEVKSSSEFSLLS
jgi:hypothetical protein